jgi:hypothetical protein
MSEGLDEQRQHLTDAEQLLSDQRQLNEDRLRLMMAQQESAKKRVQFEKEVFDYQARRKLDMDLEAAATKDKSLGTPTQQVSSVPTMTPGGTALTEEGLMKAIKLGLLANQNQPKSTPPLGLVPRVGGKNAHGHFVGLGANGSGQAPTTRLCMRAFNCDLIKAYQQLGPIEDSCTAGLSDESLFFQTETDSTTHKVVVTLKALENSLEMIGLEGVFVVIRATGDPINMLQRPGMLTEKMLQTWDDDLLLYGVWNPKTQTRLPVCPYDRTNSNWGGMFLLASCTESMRT